jgi:hypothetical protein
MRGLVAISIGVIDVGTVGFIVWLDGLQSESPVGVALSYHSEQDEHSKNHGEHPSDPKTDFVLALRPGESPKTRMPPHCGRCSRPREREKTNTE